MTANEISTIIGTVGFPIAMCGGMAWYVKYITDKNREEIGKERDIHDEELKMITDALNNNTLAIQKLTDSLGV